jgi:hypothetical protein
MTRHGLAPALYFDVFCKATWIIDYATVDCCLLLARNKSHPRDVCLRGPKELSRIRCSLPLRRLLAVRAFTRISTHPGLTLLSPS